MYLCRYLSKLITFFINYIPSITAIKQQGLGKYTDMMNGFIYLLTSSYLQIYCSVDIHSHPAHPAPVRPNICTTQIRDGRREDSFLFVIVEGVFALLAFCRRNKDVVVSTVIVAQVLLIGFITLVVGTRNIHFTPFVSRHLDQARFTGHTAHSN